MERTFVIVKPDGVKKRLVGEIISRFEKKGLYLVQAKVLIPTEDILREHYAALKHKVEIFNELIEYMQTGQVVAMVWEGDNAVKIVRDLIGVTNPLQAAIGTIRGDYGLYIGKNVIHGTDEVENVEREVELWFGKDVPAIIHFDRDLYYKNK
ncbi:uncharacterized protein VICG_00883 [Vittaforma corneae ATCC 50505]|uniref:Nucleoside diphosphate kinase n=1 Tax=Vittaforma corneae (strain ATCC 50505) TaxID=993615 RepID=L2GMG4_VITCO|nr:uncharacterized protein VICG_00883 [Vittaforma corneae ATCC 50505]ELA42036.1 hypothetical protein VICG_00883 [Vittaforma corneae ATCC 50505]